MRIVTYNTLNGPTPTNAPIFRAVFEAIGSSEVNGIAKRPDIVSLQEQSFVSTNTTANLALLLNDVYPGSNYVAVQPGQTGSDRLGFVYDASTVELQGSVAIVDSMGVRPHLRAHFRPIGYTTGQANFYVYNSHLKAGDTPNDRMTREIEAASLRGDANALPSGSHVVFTGDYNLYRSSELAYQRLTEPGGAAQAFDPINQPGDWHENASFASIHTQSTHFIGNGTFAGSGMDDRFDFQLVSSAMLDGEGIDYIPGSYRAFGNRGTTFNTNINDPPNRSPLTNSLYAASDHLPVVADYQTPARSWKFDTPPPRSTALVPEPGFVLLLYAAVALKDARCWRRI